MRLNAAYYSAAGQNSSRECDLIRSNDKRVRPGRPEVPRCLVCRRGSGAHSITRRRAATRTHDVLAAAYWEQISFTFSFSFLVLKRDDGCCARRRRKKRKEKLCFDSGSRGLIMGNIPPAAAAGAASGSLKNNYIRVC